MMILVAVSSKHGSTREIAASIAETIREAEIDVDVADAAQVTSVESYDALVIGSALYFGRWMAPARQLVERIAATLDARPVWLFSSGPLGRGIVDPADSAEGERLLSLVRGRDHRVFAGAADRGRLGFIERRILSMIRNPYGDHREWPSIRTWAMTIAGAGLGT